MNGIILLNKAEDETSFDSLRLVKKYTKTNRVGHTGTLDKFATGLLVVLIGKYTKLSNYITDLDKEYIAEFKFGTETDTLDPNGNVVNRSSVIPILNEIEKSLNSNFIGEIYQVPPKFSSIHINGKRAYELALKGAEFEIQKRNINIYETEILSYDFSSGLLSLKVHCSKGTYIRSIARDLAYSLNSCAYVKSLKRTKVGKFNLEDAVLAENLNENSLISLESLDTFRIIYIEESKISLVKNGVYIVLCILPKEMAILKSKNNEILAVVQGLEDEKYKYIVMF